MILIFASNTINMIILRNQLYHKVRPGVYGTAKQDFMLFDNKKGQNIFCEYQRFQGVFISQQELVHFIMSQFPQY